MVSESGNEMLIGRFERGISVANCGEGDPNEEVLA